MVSYSSPQSISSPRSSIGKAHIQIFHHAYCNAHALFSYHEEKIRKRNHENLETNFKGVEREK